MDDCSTPAGPPVCGETSADSPLPARLRAWLRLVAATGTIEQRLRARLKETLGVSQDEFLILCLLADHPAAGLRMSRIAECLGRPKTRLTYQVACLQHAGLVARRSTCGDKRGIDVTLTEKARQLLDVAAAPLGEALTEAFAETIGPEHREALRELLSDTPETSPRD
jgi:DNA-binding MarR family transcriptional regulator